MIVKEMGIFRHLDPSHTKGFDSQNAFEYRHLDESHRPANSTDTDLPITFRHLDESHVKGDTLLADV